MSEEKKTIQEALAEVQRNAELKRIQEAKSVWGEALDEGKAEAFSKFMGKIFSKKPKAEFRTPEAEVLQKGSRAGDSAKDITGKAKEIKPDTSTGKTKIEPAEPSKPSGSGLGSKVLGFGLGAGLGTVIGDRLAKKAKDSTPSDSEPSAGTSATETPKKDDAGKDMTFGQAFAAARKAATEKGAKPTGQFSWHGKDYQTNIQGKGTPKAPEEKYVAPSKQTKVDIGTKASAPADAPAQTPPKQSSGDSYTNGREPGWRDTPPQPAPTTPKQGFSGSTKDTTPIGPDPTKFTKPESESGGKRKKVNEAMGLVGPAGMPKTGGGIVTRTAGKTVQWKNPGSVDYGSDAAKQSQPKPTVPVAGKSYTVGKHYVTQLNKTEPGEQATMKRVGVEKGWSDAGRWENEVRSQTGTAQQVRTTPDNPQRHVVDTATQQVGKPAGETSTSNFLKSQGVGVSTEDGGKKKKMSEETNPLIAAFLKLQSENPSNMFEAAKKLSPKQRAKMDVDKDNDIDADDLSALRARKDKMEEENIDPVITGSSSVTKSKTGYVDPSTPTQPYTKAPMSTGAGDVIDKAKGALDKKGVREAYMQVFEGKKARERREDGYGYDRHGNLKNPEDKYDDNNERVPAKNSRSSSSDETNDIIKGSAPMKGLQNAGGYGAGEASDPGGRKDKEINDMLKGSAPMKGLVNAGGYGAGEASDPGGRKEKEINDLIKGSAPIKGLVNAGGYSGKERPANIPKGEYEYFPGMKKDPKGLSYRAVDEAKKARTEDGISGSAPIKGLQHSGGYGAGEASDPGGRNAAETNAVLRGSAPIKGLQHSGGYDAVQRGEHLYKYNLSTGEKIPGGNAEMPAGWSPKTSGKSNWEKSKDWEPTPTTSKADADKQQKWDAYKKTLKPLPKDMPEEVELEEDFKKIIAGVKGSEKGHRYVMHTYAPGEHHEWSSIVKTHQNGHHLQNEYGGYPVVKTGKTKYIRKHFDNVGKLSEENEVTFSQAEIDHLNSFFLEASVAPNRPEVARGADSTSDKMSQNDVTATAESGKKKIKEETLEEGRPKKNPTPETLERDPRKHIQVEAGRAAAGNVIDFTHNDGSKSKITPPMGRKIVAHLQGLKPADRQAAVNKMHDSPEGLKV